MSPWPAMAACFATRPNGIPTSTRRRTAAGASSEVDRARELVVVAGERIDGAALGERGFERFIEWGCHGLLPESRMLYGRRMHELHRSLPVFDGLIIANFSRAVFEDMRRGGLTAANCTCSIWEGFSGTMQNVMRWK